jgi:hypothetical protein
MSAQLDDVEAQADDVQKNSQWMEMLSTRSGRIINLELPAAEKMLHFTSGREPIVRLDDDLRRIDDVRAADAPAPTGFLQRWCSLL